MTRARCVCSKYVRGSPVKTSYSESEGTIPKSVTHTCEVWALEIAILRKALIGTEEDEEDRMNGWMERRWKCCVHV